MSDEYGKRQITLRQQLLCYYKIRNGVFYSSSFCIQWPISFARGNLIWWQSLTSLIWESRSGHFISSVFIPFLMTPRDLRTAKNIRTAMNRHRKAESNISVDDDAADKAWIIVNDFKAWLIVTRFSQLIGVRGTSKGPILCIWEFCNPILYSPIEWNLPSIDDDSNGANSI